MMTLSTTANAQNWWGRKHIVYLQVARVKNRNREEKKNHHPNNAVKNNTVKIKIRTESKEMLYVVVL